MIGKPPGRLRGEVFFRHVQLGGDPEADPALAEWITDAPKHLRALLEGLEEAAGERTVWTLTQTRIRAGNSHRMELSQSRMKQKYHCGMLFTGSLWKATLHTIHALNQLTLSGDQWVI